MRIKDYLKTEGVVHSIIDITIFDSLIKFIQSERDKIALQLKYDPKLKVQESIVQAFIATIDFLTKILSSKNCLQHMLKNPLFNDNKKTAEYLEKANAQLRKELKEEVKEEFGFRLSQAEAKIKDQIQLVQQDYKLTKKQQEEFENTNQQEIIDLLLRLVNQIQSLTEKQTGVNDQLMTDVSDLTSYLNSELTSIQETIQFDLAIINQKLSKPQNLIADKLRKRFKTMVANQQQSSQQRGPGESSDNNDFENILIDIEPKMNILNLEIVKLNRQIFLDQDQIIITDQFSDRGNSNYAIIKQLNGKNIIGGKDKKLNILTQDFKLQQFVNVSDQLYSGIAIGDKVFCGLKDKKLTVLNGETYNVIKTFETQNIIRKMLVYSEDYVITAGDGGEIDIIQASTLQFKCNAAFKKKPHIYDLVFTQNEGEIAVATYFKGILFADIHKDERNFFNIYINQDETYLSDKWVQTIACAQENLIIACVQGMQNLIVIDRSVQQATKQILINSFNLQYYSLQQIIGYDNEAFPYLLLKDRKKIRVINTKTFECCEIIKSEFDAECCYYSMIMFQEGHKIKLQTLNHLNGTNSLKEFIIGSI